MGMDRFTGATVIDGKQYAANLLERIKTEVDALKDRGHALPGLAVVLLGDDPASAIYVASKRRQTLAAGMESFEFRLPADTLQDELLGLIARLNADPQVHGILVQLPLPKHLDPHAVIQAINPDKDVDGFHVANVGKLATGNPGLAPCTPLGCMMLIRDTIGDDLTGLHAVVVGKSNIIGKPMAQMLMNANCTVTIAHSHTRNTPELCRAADILVVAAGRPGLVRGDWIKPGAIVIDVGINRIQEQEKSRIVGDVAYREAGHARAITPVPGGVGPMTIACLLANTLTAFRRISGLAAA